MSLLQVAGAGEIGAYLANATPYLHLVGHVVMAWLWLEQGLTIQEQLKKTPTDGFLLGKEKALAYFMAGNCPRLISGFRSWLLSIGPA